MTNQPDMFPEIAAQQSTPPKPCTMPYFLVAYWPKSRSWFIHHSGMYALPEDARCHIDEMIGRGWTHVTLLKLPAALWETP